MAGAPLPPPQALRGPCRVCQGARERRESGTRGWPSTRKRAPLARPPPWRERRPTARAQPPWAGVAPGALVPVCGAATCGEGCASGRRGRKLPRGTRPQCLWLKRGSWQVTRTFTEVSPGRAVLVETRLQTRGRAQGVSVAPASCQRSACHPPVLGPSPRRGQCACTRNTQRILEVQMRRGCFDVKNTVKIPLAQ